MGHAALDRDVFSSGTQASHPTGTYAPGRSAAVENMDGPRGAGGSLFGGGSRNPLYAGSLFGDLAGAEIDIEPVGSAGGGGDIAESIDGGDALASVEGAESPTDVAEAGFRGAATALPYRAQLEQQFGVSLDGVEAFSDEAAQQANEKLGAHAYAAGHRIAFATPSPDISLVAHELTHVFQQTGTGPSAGKRLDGGGSGGVETAGEREAENVEAAVAAGRPASSALDVDPRRVAKTGPGPALKLAGQRPALSSPWSAGLTFSPRALEQSGNYRLWQGRGMRVPIAAVPGLFFTVTPQVQIATMGGVNWAQNAVVAHCAVNGSIAAGLSYGDPSLAELYGNLEGQASGRFRYERGRAVQTGGGGNQTQNRQAGNTRRGQDNWSLQGEVVLQSQFNVGVKLGGGIINKRFQFGQLEIGRLVGIAWVNGRLATERLGWHWGPVPARVLQEIRQMIARARQILAMPAAAARAAWTALGRAHDAVGSFLSWLNPFD